MRRLVIALVVVLALLVALDRISLHLTEQAVAEQAKGAAGLSQAPTVSADGFPFLTQALRGRYERIEVRITDLDRGGVRMAELDATLHDVRVPLSLALSGNVTGIPVDRLDATALVTYAELAHSSGIVGVTMEPEGDRLRVTGRVSVLGQTVRVSSLSAVSLRAGRIVLKATSLRVLGQTSPGLVNALTRALDVVLPVGTLPYDLQLKDLQITPAGLRLVATSGPTVLTP